MESATRAIATADVALAWTETLAAEIGPRRPTSRAERTAAEWLRARLADRGVAARLEPFPAYSTFALPYGAVLTLALAAGLLPRRRQGLRNVAALAAPALAGLEDDLRLRPLSRMLARRESLNLTATIEPTGTPRRTLCLVSHLDTSRSGLLFSAALAPHLRRLLAVGSAAFTLQGAEPLLARTASGRRLALAARTVLGLFAALLAERELRGEDVPGANDNASGAAATAALAAELAEAPLASTRIVLLVTGAEEAGLLGAEAFLRSRDTSGWLFLNFDGVCATATLRYLPREGLLRTWSADPGLLRAAAELAERRPELGLEPALEPPLRAAGLTYDATLVLARGGRALTLSAQDGAIPHYHRPSDDRRNIDRDTLARAVEVGRELIAAVDRGVADATD